MKKVVVPALLLMLVASGLLGQQGKPVIVAALEQTLLKKAGDLPLKPSDIAKARINYKTLIGEVEKELGLLQEKIAEVSIGSAMMPSLDANDAPIFQELTDITKEISYPTNRSISDGLNSKSQAVLTTYKDQRTAIEEKYDAELSLIPEGEGATEADLQRRKKIMAAQNTDELKVAETYLIKMRPLLMNIKVKLDKNIARHSAVIFKANASQSAFIRYQGISLRMKQLSNVNEYLGLLDSTCDTAETRDK